MAVISIISDTSATVFVAGKPFVVASDSPRYKELIDAITAGDDTAVERIATMAEAFTKVLGTYGDVQVFAGHVTFQGRPVTNYLVKRIVEMMRSGHEPSSHARFLDRAMRNPNREAAAQLFGWLERAKMPLVPDGRFIAWKVINNSYKDKHTGTFDNSLGVTLRMDREAVDPNMNATCSTGFHFCSPRYINYFHSSGDRLVAVVVDPVDVVAFPTDEDGSKGRACGYDILFETERVLADEFYSGKNQLVFDAFDYFEKTYPVEVVKVENGEIMRRFKTVDEAVAWIGDQPASEKLTVVEPPTYDIVVEAVEEELGVAASAATVGLKVFAERLAHLCESLGLTGYEAQTISSTLDRVEEELGLDDHSPPQIDRLARAEKAAGIS